MKSRGNRREFTVEVWMRTDVPSPIRRTQKRLCGRLEELQTAGVIDEVAVNRWGTYVYLDDDQILTETAPAHAAIAGFRRWADRKGYDLKPAFRTYSSADDAGTADVIDPWQVIRLPLVCIAVYDGETLRQVAPCSAGDRVCTVSDAIATLEHDEPLPAP